MSTDKISPTDLMYAMGSKKGWDPIPPDQYLTFMDKRYPIYIRLWAWLLSKTIRLGHFSPFAIDEKYRPLNLAVAAHELQVSRQEIRLGWKVVEAEGRGCRKGLKLYVTGEVNLPPSEVIEKVRTEPFASYMLLQISNLDSKTRQEFRSEHERDNALKRLVVADFMATVRAIFEQRADNRFQRFGLKKIRENHPVKKNGDAKRTERVKKLVPFVEKFVQQTSFEFILTSDATLHNAKNEHGTDSPSLFDSDKDQRNTEVGRSVVADDRLTDIPIESETSTDIAQRIRELLLTELRHRLPGETPKLVLCARIANRLGTAPLEFLQARIRQRFQAITSMGICVQLADDACRAWQEDETQRKRAIWARWESASWYDADIQESARRALDDPAANDRIRATAREIIEFGMKQKGAGT